MSCAPTSESLDRRPYPILPNARYTFYIFWLCLMLLCEEYVQNWVKLGYSLLLYAVRVLIMLTWEENADNLLVT